EFFSHVSHDLRNPLSAIRLASETLQERARRAVDPRGLRLAQLIDAGAARMLGMVNQILDFTRLRALALPLDTGPVDALGALTRRVADPRHRRRPPPGGPGVDLRAVPAGPRAAPGQRPPPRGGQGPGRGPPRDGERRLGAGPGQLLHDRAAEGEGRGMIRGLRALPILLL